MKTRIIAIGNSQGIRIPKPLLEESGLVGEVEVSVENASIVVRPTSVPRAGWDAVFKNMAEQCDDAWLDATSSPLSSWDEEEWQWK